MTENVTSVRAARYAGSRVHRVEDARLLTGAGTFVDDISRPGMLHACFVRSPHPRARIVSVDTSAALALPGVHAVFTAADLNPDVREAWYTGTGKAVPDTPRPPLAEGEARFAGDPVALVIADSRYIAEDGAELVDVDYEPLTAIPDYATAGDSPDRVHEGYPGNLAGQLGGAPWETLAPVYDAAPHVVTETVWQQAYAAVPMETRGLVAEWSRGSGELTVWAATQAPHEVRMFAARLLGVPEHQVRVITRDVGGGFGLKVMPLREDICVLLAARRLPAAVKWIEDRRENLQSAGQARHEHGTARLAFDESGTLLAASLDHVQDVGAYPTPWPVGTGAATGMIFPGPYRVTKGTFTHASVFSSTSGRVAYRGPWSFETLAREVTLDVAARRIGIDPAELRRRNLLRPDEMPFANPNGMPYDHMDPLETLERALAVLDYGAFRAEQARAREQGRFLGVGISCYAEPTSAGFGYYATDGATIRIEPSGKVNVYVAGGSTGNSLETTVVQLTADALGADIDDVHTIQGDTAVTPFGAGTGGSRSGSMTAGAVGVTAAGLRSKLIAMAAHKLEAAEADIDLAGSRAGVRGDPEAGVSFAELADIAYFQPFALPPGMAPGLEASGRYTPSAPILWACATHVCTCEVDVTTGAVRLLRYIVGEDCGHMINPAVVEGQIAGGVVQGIGGALLEELACDADGNPVATTFMDYLLPTAADVPVIEYAHVETAPGPGPGGYKGVGEGGAIGAPPAVVNAVADALSPFGVTVTRLPLTPARIAALIEEAQR
ncbi:MAG TPA: xanthine dehydrogenase family protein molybdopterin-binding subunit [Trebonia sp.]|nr:xanthine dehydrogenase family protein molybdopterin-binding subunit [Trebonia sp.]